MSHLESRLSMVIEFRGLLVDDERSSLRGIWLSEGLDLLPVPLSPLVGSRPSVGIRVVRACRGGFPLTLPVPGCRRRIQQTCSHARHLQQRCRRRCKQGERLQPRQCAGRPNQAPETVRAIQLWLPPLTCRTSVPSDPCIARARAHGKKLWSSESQSNPDVASTLSDSLQNSPLFLTVYLNLPSPERNLILALPL